MKHIRSKKLNASPGIFENVGDHVRSYTAENGVGLSDVSDLPQQFAAQAFAEFGERDALGRREPEAWSQMGFEDAVLCQQIFILEEQFLVDETGHVGQKVGDGDSVWRQI